ncbi:MAG: VanZ family protein [Clostridiales Family XIII bacterium]|nr:VanZ family protein [Clostridiales Family XIII bacterium]
MKYRRWLIFTILIMIIIFVFSSQDANLSNRISDFVSSLLAGRLIRVANGDFFGYFMRKFAHFFMYMLLGGVAYTMTGMYELTKAKSIGFKRRIAVTLAICVIYAVLDEFHQYFVPYRTPQWQDVLIDTGGACTGILFASLLHLVHMKMSQLRAKKTERKYVKYK